MQLTQEGYNKIEKELADRKTKVRKEIADKIEYARKLGDLSENSAYKAALEDRTINEKQIQELENILSKSKIVVKNGSGEVSVGSEVTVKIDEREVIYKIVGATEADPIQLAISDESPIGAALIGKKEGDEISVELPSGNKVFKILGVS